jgi:hypothetical protein
MLWRCSKRGTGLDVIAIDQITDVIANQTGHQDGINAAIKKSGRLPDRCFEQLTLLRAVNVASSS